MTRAEHMRWCKERAHREYDFYKRTEPGSAIRNAIGSMLSDLSKHEGTRNLSEMGFMIALTVRDEPSLFKFIDGFAE